MVGEPWSPGDSGEKLRDAIRSHIKTFFAIPRYKTRLPNQHWNLPGEGKRSKGGVEIRPVSRPDEGSAWNYSKGGREAAEEKHVVSIYVKSDQKTGADDSVSAVMGVLRSIFQTRAGMPEFESLNALGIYHCFVTPEGFEGDPNADGETVTAQQQLNLRCTTDTYLN